MDVEKPIVQAGRTSRRDSKGGLPKGGLAIYVVSLCDRTALGYALDLPMSNWKMPDQ